MENPKITAHVEGGASLGASVVSTKAQLKVGDTIMAVGGDGKPVTLTVISVPRSFVNRKERRKAQAEARAKHG